MKRILCVGFEGDKHLGIFNDLIGLYEEVDVCYIQPKYNRGLMGFISRVFLSEKLSNKILKMLILGYKTLRRGENFLYSHSLEIAEKQFWLKENLSNLIPLFKVVSFDNLAIEQLEVQKLLSPEEWEEFYMGDDGTMTFYIDMVNQQFAKSSTADFNKRYTL